MTAFWNNVWKEENKNELPVNETHFQLKEGLIGTDAN